MSSAKLNYIDAYRVLAMFLVVLNHVPLVNWMQDSQVLKFFFTGALLFVFVSGFVFSFNVHKNFKFHVFLRKRFSLVVVPYLVFSSALIIVKFRSGTDVPPELLGVIDHGWQSILWMLVTGEWTLTPLWFIPMLVIFYLCSPFFLFLARSRWFGFSVVICLLLGFCWQGSGSAYPYPYEPFLRFLGIYLLGFYIGVNRVIFDSLLQSDLLFGMLLVFYVLLIYLLWVNLLPFYVYISFLKFNLLFFCKAVFAVVLYASLARYARRSFKIVELLALYSFGIYFVHGVIFRIVFVRDEILAENIPSFLMFAVICFLLSFFVVYVCKLILGRNSRFILGC